MVGWLVWVLEARLGATHQLLLRVEYGCLSERDDFVEIYEVFEGGLLGLSGLCQQPLDKLKNCRCQQQLTLRFIPGKA